jgi:(2Fe-2S) ferredoxin
MQPIDTGSCRVHVCVCTNERGNGMSHCARVGGPEIFFRLKERALREGKAATHWITRTGCLGFCNDAGATVAVYRPGHGPQWFSSVTPAEADGLWESLRDS